MGWRTVAVTQHAKISLRTNSVVIQTNQDTFHIPVSDIQILLVDTLQAVITTAVICALSEHGVKIIFTGHSGEPLCETTLTQPTARTAELVTKQVQWSPDKIANLWTKVIHNKINNQIQVLDFLGVEHQKVSTELDALELNDPTNREAVVAHQYFPLAFGTGFSRDDFSAINAALNYGYSILLSLVNREIVANGYLTCIGIHHHSDENEYNLGSDLMEPFRPIVDQWVSQQRFKQLTPDIKYGLVDLLNIELVYGKQRMLLSNVVADYVNRCLHYLSGDTDKIEIEVTIPDEVSSNAINDHV